MRHAANRGKRSKDGGESHGLPAEQGMAVREMAAAAKENEGGNGTLGLRGGPRCA